MEDLLWFLFLFQIKHLIVDFPLQVPYMWMNKDRFDHPGGYLHAGLHAAGTFLIFAHWHHHHLASEISWLDTAIILILVEFFVHFLVDLTKMKINAWKGWKCDTSPRFWDLLGVDQFLHQLTYLWLAWKWLC